MLHRGRLPPSASCAASVVLLDPALVVFISSSASLSRFSSRGCPRPLSTLCKPVATASTPTNCARGASALVVAPLPPLAASASSPVQARSAVPLCLGHRQGRRARTATRPLAPWLARRAAAASQRPPRSTDPSLAFASRFPLRLQQDRTACALVPAPHTAATGSCTRSNFFSSSPPVIRAATDGPRRHGLRRGQLSPLKQAAAVAFLPRTPARLATMLVRPDLAGLTDSEIKGHEQIMRTGAPFRPSPPRRPTPRSTRLTFSSTCSREE